MTYKEMLEAAADGKPIQLPCKIGDIIYVPHMYKKGGGWVNKYKCSGFHITDKVTNWRKDKPSIYLVARSESGGSPKHFDLTTIGHTAFFTEEEAKRAIKLMEVTTC